MKFYSRKFIPQLTIFNTPSQLGNRTLKSLIFVIFVFLLELVLGNSPSGNHSRFFLTTLSQKLIKCGKLIIVADGSNKSLLRKRKTSKHNQHQFFVRNNFARSWQLIFYFWYPHEVCLNGLSSVYFNILELILQSKNLTQVVHLIHSNQFSTLFTTHFLFVVHSTCNFFLQSIFY